MSIQNRIEELRLVPARDLKANPKNWRLHPEEQRAALRGVLADIGFADANIARELPDGSLELIDGHLRKEENPDELIPTLITDLTQDEADKLLATLDPLAAMAKADAAKLSNLLQTIKSEDQRLTDMFARVAASADLHRSPEIVIDSGGDANGFAEGASHNPDQRLAVTIPITAALANDTDFKQAIQGICERYSLAYMIVRK